MRLMWKLLFDFMETEEYNDATMADFLNFAEKTLKATEARLGMKKPTIPSYYFDRNLTEEQKREKDLEMIAKDFPFNTP